MIGGKRIDLAALPENFMDRFWSRVEIAGPDECWEWKRGRSGDGYGAIPSGEGTKNLKANRVALAWRLGGVLEGDVLARHTCDNPPCVNPAHLLPGSHSDNMQDRSKRGRSPRGAKASQSKITEAEVLAIRAKRADGATPSEIAAEYGISPSNVVHIVAGRSWAHVKASA